MGITTGELFRVIPVTFTCLFKPSVGRRFYTRRPERPPTLTLRVYDDLASVPLAWTEDPRFPGWGLFEETCATVKSRVPLGDVLETISVSGAAVFDGQAMGVHRVRHGETAHTIRVHIFSPSEPWRTMW